MRPRWNQCVPTPHIVGGYADPPLRDDTDVSDVNANESNATVGPHARFGASLSEIIQWFKIMTTNEYIRGVKQSGWPPFRKRVWQRDYYEHIVRDDGALDRIRQYIADNPARWAADSQHP